MKPYHTILVLILILSSCEQAPDIHPTTLEGMWNIERVLANDHWGAPLYWRDAEWGKEIRFVSGQYFEKTINDFELIGTYAIISDEEIEITWDSPVNPEYPSFRLRYEFDSKGQLTLFKNQFEGVVGEQYKRSE